MKLKATLRLENGLEFHGWSFGSAEAVSGEVVFNTSMVGYPEQLTDAAYSGQILCLTYPLIGNYGVPSEELLAEKLSKNLESEKIQPKGLIAFDVCEDYSNWEAEKGLEQWMKEQNLTGIYGIDTRELTKILRDKGSMTGEIIPEGAEEICVDGIPFRLDKFLQSFFCYGGKFCSFYIEGQFHFSLLFLTGGFYQSMTEYVTFFRFFQNRCIQLWRGVRNALPYSERSG